MVLVFLLGTFLLGLFSQGNFPVLAKLTTGGGEGEWGGANRNFANQKPKTHFFKSNFNLFGGVEAFIWRG